MAAQQCTRQDEANMPKNWDMWTCFNKTRWERRAKERAESPREPEQATENRPMDWDMWNSSRQR